MRTTTEPPRRTATAAGRQMAAKTRRSFVTGGLTALGGLATLRWIGTRQNEDGLAWPLRRSLEANEKVTRAYYSAARLAPELPTRAAQVPQVNGMLGLEDEDFEAKNWRLELAGLRGGGSAALMLADVQALPKVEFVTELKCVEGWSKPVRWGGARFADLARRYHAAVDRDYAGFATPDGEYYVGLDMPSALHPQTLLCYEMDGRPLNSDHGAPLRLVIPIKYGIKNLKRIGRIEFTSTRPPDYWAERGYDYYAGF